MIVTRYLIYSNRTDPYYCCIIFLIYNKRVNDYFKQQTISMTINMFRFYIYSFNADKVLYKKNKSIINCCIALVSFYFCSPLHALSSDIQGDSYLF